MAKRALVVIAMLFLISQAWISEALAKATLRVTFSLTEREWHVMRREILPPFEEKCDCQVEAVQVSQEHLPRLLDALRLSGKMSIDVFGQDNMQLAVLVRKGLVRDLSSEEGQIPEVVVPALIEAGRFDGKLYFMPYRPNIQIVYYNKEKFRKYNVNPPRNWDELYSVAKTFYDNEGIGRVLIKAAGGISTTTQMYEFIASAGGNALSFNDQGTVNTFTFIQKLWNYIAPDSRRAKYDTSNDYLARDACYLMQNWPFGYGLLVKEYGKSNIAVYGGFSGPVRRAHVVGGEVLGIPAGSPNPSLALAFIRYMQSKKVQENLVAGLGWPSIRTDAYGQVPDWMRPQFEAVKEALQYGIFRANVPYWTEFNSLFTEAFIKIVINHGPVKATLDEYHEEMETIKKRYR
ncbi:MAG: extracellular solute-binding protein [Proteobacteria bacterium]|nr:extracellular solute-binding protein [Pseudomonadota bacterium]